MKSIKVLVAQMNTEHANRGHVLQSTIAEAAAAIEALPNDTSLELRVIEGMVSPVSYLLGDLDTCKEDPVLVSGFTYWISAHSYS